MSSRFRSEENPSPNEPVGHHHHFGVGRRTAAGERVQTAFDQAVVGHHRNADGHHRGLWDTPAPPDRCLVRTGQRGPNGCLLEISPLPSPSERFASALRLDGMDHRCDPCRRSITILLTRACMRSMGPRSNASLRYRSPTQVLDHLRSRTMSSTGLRSSDSSELEGRSETTSSSRRNISRSRGTGRRSPGTSGPNSRVRGPLSQSALHRYAAI